VISSDVITEKLETGLAITKSGAGRVVILNATGCLIWNLLDGQKTLDLLISSLATQFELTPAAISQDVNDFIDRLRAAGLIVEKYQ
jgi:hypothetical protein